MKGNPPNHQHKSQTALFPFLFVKKEYLHKPLVFTAVFCLTLATQIFSQSQTKLIQPSDSLPSSLITEQLVRYNKVSNANFASATYLIELADLHTAISNEKVIVSIPDSECGDVVFQTFYSEYESEDEYRWEGEVKSLDSCQCSDGYLVLVAREGRRFGHLSLDEEYYEISELGGGKNAITKVDFEDFTGEECGNATEEEEEFRTSGVNDRDEEHCEVRILIVYNQSALDAEGSVDAVKDRISLAMTQTQKALKNSKVFEDDLRLVYAGIEQVNFTQINVNAQVEIENLSSDAAITGLRDSTGADIVVLLTGDDYKSVSANGDTSDIAGRAGTLTLDEALAYVIVETGNATTSRYTFAHEVAHIFGCRHEFAADTTSGIMHGYSFDACGDRYTLMHRISENGSRILHYSNPYSKYAGEATGTVEREYNAAQLRSTACTVATFRETVDNPFGIGISGERLGCPCINGIFTASIWGGVPGTYTLEWRTSTDGVNYGSPIGSTNQVQVEYPCDSVGDILYLRLKVTAPNNDVKSTFKKIESTNSPPGGGNCPEQKPSATQPAISEVDALKVNPNPADGSFTVEFQTGRAGEVSVQLISTNGGQGKTLFVGTMPSGEHALSFSTDDLTAGAYILRLSGTNNTQTRLIIIH